jgi:hypothetical protein
MRVVAATHDTFEYATLLAAMAVAVGTLAAVGTALFGPGWLSRRRRPRLSIEPDGFAEAIIMEADPSIQLVTLRLDNAVGRDRAEDVEVYVDIGWELEPSALLPLVEQELLPFGDPRQTPPPPTSKNVAAGFSRWMPLFLLGDGPTLARECGLNPDAEPSPLPVRSVGAVAIARLRQERAWLTAAQEFFITVTVTGANFDAISHAGSFVLEVTDMDMVDGTLRSIEVKWTRQLKPTHRREPPTRLAAAP